MPLRRTLLSVCSAILVLTVFGRLGSATWWPWEPLRMCVALTVAAAVLGSPRRTAILAVCVWAFVASPLVIAQQDRGFAWRYPNTVPGEVIGKGVPSGPYAVNAGAVPVGLTRLGAADRNYVNGEGSDAEATLVAWSITLVPWPHVDRTSIIGLGGNTIDYWAFPEAVEVHRDGHDLLVSGKRLYPGPPHVNIDLPEARALVWRPTGSAITILGWLLIALAAAVRFWRRATPAQAAEVSAPASDANATPPATPTLVVLAAAVVVAGVSVSLLASELGGGDEGVVAPPRTVRQAPAPPSRPPADLTGLAAPPALDVAGKRIRERLDATARSDARRLVAYVEACFTETRDYTQCITASALGATGISYGRAAKQVSVTAAAVRTYEVTAVSASGNTFLISRDRGGGSRRTCTMAGNGGCRMGGTW